LRAHRSIFEPSRDGFVFLTILHISLAAKCLCGMAKKILNIAVDIDGVLLDFIDQFIPIVKDRFGATLTHRDIVTHDLHLVLGISFKEVWDIVNETLATQVLPVIPGAQEGMKTLGRHNLAIVTSRPEVHYQRTVENLQRYGFDVGRIYFRKYLKKFTERDGTDVLIEDSLEEALLASDFIPNVLLYRQPWNSFTMNVDHRLIPVDNWEQIVSFIAGLDDGS
jgi:uncharacterized HAD superfamily protein